MKTISKIITLTSLTLAFWCVSDKIASKLIYISRNLNPFAKRINEPIKTTEKPSPLEFKTIQAPPETAPTSINYLQIPLQKETIYQLTKYNENPEPIYQNITTIENSGN